MEAAKLFSSFGFDPVNAGVLNIDLKSRMCDPQVRFCERFPPETGGAYSAVKQAEWMHGWQRDVICVRAHLVWPDVNSLILPPLHPLWPRHSSVTYCCMLPPRFLPERRPDIKI
jgi:hypothetical protein